MMSYVVVEKEFQTLTMVNILLNQGDRQGARALFDQLCEGGQDQELKNSQLYDMLKAELCSTKTGESAYLETLEKWLSGIQAAKQAKQK